MASGGSILNAVASAGIFGNINPIAATTIVIMITHFDAMLWKKRDFRCPNHVNNERLCHKSLQKPAALEKCDVCSVVWVRKSKIKPAENERDDIKDGRDRAHD